MDFIFRRSYRGPLKAVILDWAGTTVDYGSFAPTAALVETFKNMGVHITVAQARRPMGMHKKDHIRAVTQAEPVAREWESVHGRPCSEADVEMMFQAFLPVQVACIADYAGLIPGTLDVLADFRRRGLKIGTTTGYTRPMMNALLPESAKRGYIPDSVVCPDEVPAGRPHPWMAWQNVMNLGVYPLEACVKIGDTIPDIEEGLNAGVWTIGLVKSGNEIGLLEQEIAALDSQTLDNMLAQGGQRLRQAGAHFVVDTIADVLPVFDEIQQWVARGERP
jgi:phosphonoacetaldehyde hydrolase